MTGHDDTPQRAQGRAEADARTAARAWPAVKATAARATRVAADSRAEVRRNHLAPTILAALAARRHAS